MPRRIELWRNGLLIDSFQYRPEMKANVVERLNATEAAHKTGIRAVWA